VTVLVRLAYDGTDFHGWAKQPARADGTPVRTVQGEVERALSTICGGPVGVRGASRTDAGVHAEGQLCAFERIVPIPCANLVRALGRSLPRDLAATDAWDADDGADPRHGNLGKHYAYRIRTAQVGDPKTARYEWRIDRALDVAAMREAAPALLGTHDFAAFRSSMCQASTTVRTITAVDLVEHGDRLDIHVRGTAFLHNMVRIIVGTLVDLGHGRGDAGWIPSLLADGDRTRAGRTAPPEGLTLVEVSWPDRPMSAR
jgi:tRNA pseudouridine38-40 synthase